ncbi:MAG: hypothetical protein IJ337_00950 [Clostridia bacterium]|nr:hypothetical protein [Clostridia bacterium]
MNFQVAKEQAVQGLLFFRRIGDCAKNRAAGTELLKMIKLFGSGSGYWPLLYGEKQKCAVPMRAAIDFAARTTHGHTAQKTAEKAARRLPVLLSTVTKSSDPFAVLQLLGQNRAEKIWRFLQEFAGWRKIGLMT